MVHIIELKIWNTNNVLPNMDMNNAPSKGYIGVITKLKSLYGINPLDILYENP